MSASLYLVLCFLVVVHCCMSVGASRSPFGPVYPVTASWFANKYSLAEWDTALDQYKAIGGDTVLQVGAFYNNRTRDSIVQDKMFAGCVTNGVHCTEDAEQELTKSGLKIASWVTYENDEKYGPKILVCPLDKKMATNSAGVTFHRIVLHTTIGYDRDSCEFEKGANVTVMFTAFTSTDPHELLLQSASSKKNISVYFGLPRLPRVPESDTGLQMIISYSEWVYRLLLDHNDRYGAKYSSTLVGYYSGDAYDLGDLTQRSGGSSLPSGQSPTAIIAIYREVTALVHYNGKMFATAPSIDLRKSQKRDLTDYSRGMMLLAFLGADVIAVQEGRGLGKSAYFGVNETSVQIKDGDETLFKILKKNNPRMQETITFGDMYIHNTQSVFQFLSSERKKNQIQSELWLVVQAFDDLEGDCSLEVDFTGSGIPSKVSPVGKSRVDWAISAAGGSVQKIAAIAWDALFTCTGKGQVQSLAQQIKADLNRPIVTYCNFHNPQNLSVVVIGYGIEGVSVGFELRYKDSNGVPQRSDIGGYYFWLDYGVQRHLVPSLEYIMLWDGLPLDKMPSRGFIYVIPYGAYHGCIFEYDWD